ncbi:MAG TPA: hypothetical protein VND20_01785 [Candidatus Binataceae bacterium]|nr:hypothetical protein [Candidatus Binataceae bacterium]
MSSRFCAVSSEPNPPTIGSDLILPCQYYDISGGHHLTGEQRLMLAMLTDAINVYQKGVLSHLTSARRLYVDAERWIMREGPAGDALPFDTVCDALGINAGLLRRRIIGWKHTVHRKCDAHPTPGTRIKVAPRMSAARDGAHAAGVAARPN